MDTAPKPAVYGASDRPPRGDYTTARADYTCAQPWEHYTADEHARYARLYQRQTERLQGRACDEFIDALARLGPPDAIPRFDAISERLRAATGWEVVAVPGLIPEDAFFSLLAARRFPVTHWLRTEAEFDYIVEPDLFHDLFGHVPLLFDPVFADYMEAFGAGGLKAQRLDALEYLSRLYWYTVEFGLIRTPDGLRAYGAGILSSVGELERCLIDPAAKRLPFDAARLMRTRYKIDTYQDTYFVIDSFAQLFEATAPDYEPIYAQLRTQPELAAGALQPGEAELLPNPTAAG